MINTKKKLKTLNLTIVFKLSLLSGLLSITVGCLGTPPAGTSLIESVNAAEKTETNLEQLTPRHSFEYKIINSMLKRYHYKKFELNDDFSGKILDQYIKQLDPSRIYFTQADIKQFDKHRDKFDDYINAGDTEVAVNIFKKYQQRVNERSKYAIQRLDQKFDLDKDEEYNLDREKARWEVKFNCPEYAVG